MMFDEAIHDLLLTAGVAVQTETEYTAPVVSGKLRGDISVSMGLDRKSVSVGNTGLIEYARYVYYGTKPHTIKPKRKKALKTPYGTFTRVNHPGTKANPYLDNALERLVSSGRLEHILRRHSDKFSEAVFEDIVRNLTNIEVK